MNTNSKISLCLWLNNIIYIYKEKCMCVYIYIYILFPWWTLRLFPCLVNNAAVNTGMRYLFEILILFPSDKYPEVELLDDMAVLLLIFWDTSNLFSMVAASIYNSVHKCSLSSTYLQNWLSLSALKIVIKTSVKWLLTVVFFFFLFFFIFKI